jgi:ferredoxin
MGDERPEPLSRRHPDSVSRRDFLKKTAVVAAGILAPAAALESFTLLKGASPAAAQETTTTAQIQPHWQFLVDTYKCVGCGFCVKACKLENEVPYDANATRNGRASSHPQR